MIEAVREFEKSQQRGKKDEKIFTPHKVVVGNKKDLKQTKQVLNKDDLTKLNNILNEGLFDEHASSESNGKKNYLFKEVAAITNFGVQEVFGELVNELL